MSDSYLGYFIIRLMTFPFSIMPYSWIHAIGRCLGLAAYYLIPKFRKKALSNLVLAKDLHLSNTQAQQIAKLSFQNLMITALEYPKLAKEKKISKIALCTNPEKADEIMKEGNGVIFFCGHQANWELFFLEGTSRMPGVAIGRPIKNRFLYDYVLKIRQKYGGKIVSPKEAIKEGLLGLRRGAFLGIVGDQGMPHTGHFSSFLGRGAWTSPLPALLAYKTQTPIIVASMQRNNNKYYIHYSDPIYPNEQAPMDLEIKRLMDETLSIFQDTIRACPGQWLWQHNRWKQQTLDQLKKPYRYDAIAIFLPDDEKLIVQASIFRKFYPTEFLALFVPQAKKHLLQIDAEIHPYSDPKECFVDDLRFKLIYNFTEIPNLEKHYKSLAALSSVYLKTTDLKTTLENLIRPCPTTASL